MSLFDRLFTKSRTAVLHITSANGFHLRPAAVFVKEAQRFSCTVEAETREKSVNAKHLNALLSLNLDKGDHFDLVCKGKDAESAIEILTQTFNRLMENDTQIERISPEKSTYRGVHIKADSITSGIAIAPLWHYTEEHSDIDDSTDFNQAIDQSLTELDMLSRRDAQHIDSSIYTAQKVLLETLAKENHTIEAFEAAIIRESNALRGSKMEAKIIDYRDLLARVKRHMGTQTTVPYPAIPFILVADDLFPSQVETLPKHTAGVILQQTSLISHTAILLRATDIPSLIIYENIPLSDQMVILDAHSSTLVIEPTENDLMQAEQRKQKDDQTRIAAKKKRFEAAVTTQGKQITLLANVTDISSAESAREEGAEGIGLLRTEFLFKEEAPTFEQQRDIYAAIFDLFDHVTIRTLDVGGDKALPYINLPKESNPFLGIRGIRLFKTHPELMEMQLHAIFEAANGKALQIMFPMVSMIEEFIEAKTFAQEIAQKYDCDITNITFGIMVEVPSVLFLLKEFNHVVDFYSIGTNDLNQYLFSIERTHPTLTLNPHSEVLFRAIEKIVQEADKPVSICGELAGDPEAAARLITMGIEILSVSPKRIAPLKETIRHV